MRRQLRFVLPCVIAVTIFTSATRHATDESAASRGKTDRPISVDNNSVASIAPAIEAEPMPVQTEEPVRTEKLPAKEVALSRGGSGLPEYKQTFIANISAYTPFDAGCDRTTASGEPVRAKHTIAMDSRFPMGTKVMIEGFPGIVFEVDDRGGAIRGNKIDVFMETLKEAKAFGRKSLRVWILK